MMLVQPQPLALLQPALEPLLELRAVVGADRVLTGAESLPYATDVYRSLFLPLAVVRPGSVAELQSVVKICASSKTAMFVRGGGASYTDAYLPSRPDSILIDMGRLNNIVELNERDAYVTVEAGTTWLALKNALDPQGWRTPFFGPFSGSAATVGGSISQHSISHGSGTHGISAQSVVSMDVVLASGELIRTGSAARGAEPFCRWYGPDVAGLFCGDCGCLGVKARVTLPLLRRAAAFECLSFAFQTLAPLARSLRAAALERLDDEHFAIDAAISQGQIARQERISKRGVVSGIWKSAPSAYAGLKQLLRIARAGSKVLRGAPYTAHFVVEGVTRRDARIKAERLRQIMANEGTEVPNSVPAVVRGVPFAPLYNALGPAGERWVPVHGYLPHSRVEPFHDAVEGFFAERAAEMRRLGVWRGGMYMTVGSSAFLYEIALYWPGVPSAYHKAAIPAEYLTQLPAAEDSAQVNAFVAQLKADLIALYTAHAAAHFQLGKTYPFASVLLTGTLNLMRSIKRAVDPDGLMNPGALEL